MSSPGVLASMMSLMYPKIEPYDAAQVYRDAIQTRTNLLALQEVQRQRDVAAEARAFWQQHPEMLQGGGMPQSAIGALGTAGGPGPITQTTTQPPDALMGTPGTQTTQTIPGYPDMSRFAGVSP